MRQKQSKNYFSLDKNKTFQTQKRSEYESIVFKYV